MLKAAQKLASSFVPVPSAVEGFVGAVGNTSLIRLKTLSDQTGCNVYGKAEFTNPGGSVKDRAAIGLIEAFEKNGELKKGGTVVEGTAGNTGIGLAHVCRAKGYKCVIYMPDTQSPAKVSLLKLLGADVRPVPAVAYDNPQNYNHQASRFAKETPNAVWTNQFDNLNNRQIHIETTGPEIWAQTQGTIDAFTCSAGTGGSLAGVTHYLKSISDGKVKSYLADPPGSCLYSWVTSGGKSLERSGGSITEGIGQGRITDNFGADWKKLDGAFRIPDADTIRMVYSLLDKEGLYLGASSCLNVVGALRVAQHLGPGHTVVTLLCDGADRYASRLFSKKWLEQKKLYQELPQDLLKYAALE